MSPGSAPLTVLLAGPTPPAPAVDRILERLRALPSVAAVVHEPYDEPHSLRTARSLRGGPDLRAKAPALTAAQQTAFAAADVALALDLPFDVARVAPRLRWVHGLGVGTAQLQSAGLFDAGITLTNSVGVSADGIAEFVLARLLQHAKGLRELDRRQGEHRWHPLHGGTLAGATMVLVGLGSINRAVATLASAFGMHVVGCHRTARRGDPPPPHVDEVVGLDELDATLSRADVVVFAVPETPLTIGMLDRPRLARLKPGTVVCNVGRGSLVDEAALVDLLQSGHLGAAILDVSATEPLPADDPLWEAPNLYYSPHCSVVVERMFENVYRLFEENIRRFIDGRPLIGLVSPEQGY